MSNEDTITYEMRCMFCGFVAGQSATICTDFTCSYCIQERRLFSWIFSGLPEILDRNEYWKQYDNYFPGDRPQRAHQIRYDQMQQIQEFIVALKTNPDILKVEKDAITS